MRNRSVAIAIVISAIMVASSLTVIYSGSDFNHSNPVAVTNLQPASISNITSSSSLDHAYSGGTTASSRGYNQVSQDYLSSAVNISGSISSDGSLLYPVDFVQSGLPIGMEWNITLNGKIIQTYNISYSTYLPSGNYSYNISNSGVFYPENPSGKLSIVSSGDQVNTIFSSESGISSTLSFFNNTLIQGYFSPSASSYGPYAATYNPVNGLYYTANIYNGTVSIINASVGKIFKTLKVGVEPLSFSVNTINGTVYVANMLSSTISFIGLNNTVTLNLSVIHDPSHLLFDPFSGNLFVTNVSNSMEIINRDNKATTVNFDSPVSQMVLDSSNGNIFVKTTSLIESGFKSGARQIYYLSGNGSLYYGFNLTRNTAPNSIAYDPVNNEIFSVFSVTIDRPLIESSINGTVAMAWDLGYEPSEIFYDAFSNSFYIFSYNGENTSIRIYSGNMEPLNSMSLRGEIHGIAFGISSNFEVIPDSYNNELYLLSPIYNTRSVVLREQGISGSTEWGISYYGHKYVTASQFLDFTTFDSSLILEFLNVSGYDKPVNIEVNSGSSNVNIEGIYLKLYTLLISEKGLPDQMKWSFLLNNQTFLTSGGNMALNLTNGTYSLSVLKTQSYYPDPSNETLRIQGSDISTIIDFSASLYRVEFKENGLPSGTLWFLNLSNGERFNSTGSSIQFNDPNNTYHFTVSSGNKTFTPIDSVGIFSINGNMVSINVTFKMVTYSLNVTETGLPHGISWYFGFQGAGTMGTIKGSSFSMNLPNGTYQYLVKSGNSEYFSSVSEGIFTIHGSSVALSIEFEKMTYGITFNQINLPLGTVWYVNLSNGQTFSSRTSSITFNEPNGTYSYTIQTSNKIYEPAYPSGTLNVNGNSVSKSIAFNMVRYKITFTENGLPSGATWYVNLLNLRQPGPVTGDSYSIYLTNGTYAFTVQTSNKMYESNVSYGLFRVNGFSINKPIKFTEVTYRITFTETGLLQNAAWYVNLSNGQSFSSRTSSITFNEPNGTYSYTIQTSNSKYSAVKPAGDFMVNGNSMDLSVRFYEVTYKVIFTDNGLPPGTTWYVNLTGGQSLKSSLSTISVELPNGSYGYTISTINKTFKPAVYASDFVINGSSLSHEVYFNEVVYMVEVETTQKLPGSGWSLFLGGRNVSSTHGNELIINLPNGTYTYNAVPWNNIYRTISGTFTVNGGNSTLHLLQFHAVRYLAQIQEEGLPQGTTWFMNLSNGMNISSITNLMALELTNGTYTYSIVSGNSLFHPASPSGTFRINGKNVSFTVIFKKTVYSVTFVNNMNNNAIGSKWYVNLSNGESSGPIAVGTNYTFTLQNGTYTYLTASSNSSLRVYPGSGVLKVNGNDIFVYVQFQKVNYTVVFISNLKNVPWNVTVGSLYEFSPTGGPLTFQLSNGTYSYFASIDQDGHHRHYQEYVNGTLNVTGKNVTVNVTFEKLHKVKILIIAPPVPSVNYTWTLSLQNNTYLGKSNVMNMFLEDGNYSALLSLNISIHMPHTISHGRSHNTVNNTFFNVTVPFDLIVNGSTTILVAVFFTPINVTLLILEFNTELTGHNVPPISPDDSHQCNPPGVFPGKWAVSFPPAPSCIPPTLKENY